MLFKKTPEFTHDGQSVGLAKLYGKIDTVFRFWESEYSKMSVLDKLPYSIQNFLTIIVPFYEDNVSLLHNQNSVYSQQSFLFKELNGLIASLDLWITANI